MTRRILDMGDRELDIMQELWKRGPATVAEVQTALENRGVRIAYNTIQTMLNRLEEKGVVARDGRDRAHVYRPLQREDRVVRGAIGKLTSRFFGGSAEALATRLVTDDLGPEELERLRRLIDERRKKA